MKKIVAATLVIFMGIGNAFTQDCIFYYPKTKGATLEYRNFDKKNSLAGISRHNVKEISQSGNAISAVIEVENFDKKEKSLGKSEIAVKCEDGVYYLDMKSFVSPETMAAYKDMDVSIESDNLQMPGSLKIGDKLNDGFIKITVTNAGMKLMTMTTTIANRKVEAKEQITTPAGAFDCYKISSEITSKSFMTIKVNSIEWYSKDIGVVKSESYSGGKLNGTTVLSAIKQ